MIIRNAAYIPHQAIVITTEKNLTEFSLEKVAYAYQKRRNYLGQNEAICEVEFHPTNRCNLMCKGCSYGTRHNQDSLTLEQVKTVLDQYAMCDLRSVFFSGGGDPLLWEHWREFFETIEKKCSYGIATNMYNFKAISDFWTIFDFYQIHVTGYSASTSRTTTGIDSFRQTDENISFILKHKLPKQNITLKVLVNEENCNDLSGYFDYMLDKEADSIVLKYQQDFIRNRDLATLSVLDLVREKVYGHPIVSKYGCLIDNLDDIVYKSYPRPEKCLFANSGLYRLINANGEVFPCIAANANRNNQIDANKGFVDVYSKTMSDGLCPLRACRHYRFSQYLFATGDKMFENDDVVSMPLLL